VADEHDEAGIFVEEGDQVVLLNVLPQAGFPVELTSRDAGIWESFQIKVNNDSNKNNFNS
jgi:hypothetical protein